jgi:hypothetical protein
LVEPTAGISTSAVGAIVVKRGVLAPARFEASLSLTAGDRVYVSPTVAGRVTNVRPTTVGQVVIEVGRITSTLVYDGATQLLAEIQLVDGERVVVSAAAGAGSAIVETLTNANAGTMTEGQAVYLTATNDEVDLADASLETTPARVVAWVQDTTILTTASGNFVTSGTTNVRLNAGLTVNPGDTIYLSTTAGECTNVAPSALGNVVQPVGRVKNTLTYDGGSDRLVEMIISFGNRNIAS